MSFVLDQIRRIDAQLDRLQLAGLSFSPADPSAEITRPYDLSRTSTSSSSRLAKYRRLPNGRSAALQTAVRALSPDAAAGTTLLKTSQITTLLSTLSVKFEEQGDTTLAKSGVADVSRDSGDGDRDFSEEDIEADLAVQNAAYEANLEWLLVSKATTQVYGHVLTRILDETVALSNDVWYWDEVLSSRRQTAWYAVQTSPWRVWHWSSAVWADVRARGGNLGVLSLHGIQSEGQEGPLAQRWRQFYHLVREVVVEKSVMEVRAQFLGPITRTRGEVRQKRNLLKQARLRNANALGILLGEGLANESTLGEGLSTPTQQDSQHRWKVSVARNVALMEAVLVKINDHETAIEKFDSAIAELTDDDPLYVSEVTESPLQAPAVADRLTRVLLMTLPEYDAQAKTAVRDHGRPSRLVRFWLPITIGVLSSSTLLRILFNRQAQLTQWLQDLGTTVIDFWQNWVVEPSRNLIKTIRHDADSEISIISKRSLAGDRESLERMVIDFARDNPSSTSIDTAPSPNRTSVLTDAEISALRVKIREGDLTPILRAYEKDLSSPLMGALRGNLIRALLIQIQKTKVDIEIAMGGIDSLLKSQELLIGFISLTPGLILTAGAVHWLRSSFTRTGTGRPRSPSLLPQIRNIDRILSRAHPTDFAELPYRDMGLLLCEAHLLRTHAAALTTSSSSSSSDARKNFSQEDLREFRDDLDELCDVRVGVERQRKCLERLRWGFVGGV